MLKLFVLTSVLTFTITQAAMAQAVVSDFSSGADGWTIFNTSTGSSGAATFDSPGGYITEEERLEVELFFMQKPRPSSEATSVCPINKS